MNKKKLIISLLIAAALVPVGVFAATAVKKAKAPFTYGVWIPYWQSQAGEESVSVNLDKLNEISPFSYQIGSGGALIDSLGLDNGSWNAWLSSSYELGIKVIPTIADFNPTAIYNLLSNTKSRQSEENQISALAKAQNFNGIDIDFEDMDPDTQPYYSLFIEGLASRLHAQNKLLTCTVIARTPPDELYQTIPDDIVYPEDYSVLNQNCDEVRVMAYDQDTIDLTLDAEKGNGNLYSPVADPAWVQSVLQETLKSVSSSKVVLGIPTYGYEYEVDWQNGVTAYTRVRAFDYLDAMDRADSLGITPTRNSADELTFTYSSSTYISEPPILVSTVLSPIEPAALMNPNPNATTTFFVSFPDAQSIADEIALAKKDGLRGAMLFKADGDIDPATWNYMN
jgi:spore germination protein YaaH